MEAINNELLDYYHSYCELTIWFKKIVLLSDSKAAITMRDVASEFMAERNRLLQFVPQSQRRKLKTELNKILKGYCYKVSGWSRMQRITLDMV